MLWNKRIQKEKSGVKRIEEKTDLDIFLESVEWVDLGHDVLYSKFDFPVDKELLSINDLQELIKNLPTDISIMNKNCFKWIQDNCKIIKYQDETLRNSNLITSICCGNKKGYIHFYLPLNTEKQKITYFIKELSSKDNIFTSIEVNEIGPDKFPSYLGTTRTIRKFKMDNNIKQYNIKLVKIK